MLDSLVPVIVRIVSRYLVGGLVAVGLLTAAQGETLFADPEVQALITLVVGGVLTALIEIAYALARRFGGPT